MSEIKALHFTLDESAGALLMTIAQEHLMYSNDIEKSIKTITESLTGCPVEIALDLIHGTKVIYVITENGEQFFSVGDRIEGYPIEFPKLDCVYYAKRNAKEINRIAIELRATLRRLTVKASRSNFVVDFPYEDIFKFINREEDAEDLILNRVRNDSEFGELETVILSAKAFLEKSVKTQAIIQFMWKTWAKDFETDEDFFSVNDQIHEINANLQSVINALSDLISLNFDKIREDEDSVKKFVDSAMEIDRVIEKGIEPVDLMDNYSAGWLAPDGTYYALNGEIANMLHNQIATALFEKGLIPDEGDNKNNPDNWLLAQGWVRVHGNNIMFEANCNERVNRGRNKYMTDVQIDMITNYCRLHHGQVVNCMFQPISALSFQMLAKSGAPSFYKKYFMGD